MKKKQNFKRLEYFNPDPMVTKAMQRHEAKIMSGAISQLFPRDYFDSKLLTRAEEVVSNYSMTITTYRYKGELIMRRFYSGSKEGLYRYESPIFN